MVKKQSLNEETESCLSFNQLAKVLWEMDDVRDTRDVGQNSWLLRSPLVKQKVVLFVPRA